MADSTPNDTGRRRRSILLGVGPEPTSADEMVQEIAAEVRASVHVGSSSSELLTLLDHEKETACLVVLPAELPDVAGCFRLFAQKAPLCSFVVLATETQKQRVQQQLAAFRVGSQVQYLSPQSPDLRRTFQAAYHKADQRKATRTTLDRFNARLSVPAESVDTQQLRQLVISDRFLSSILEAAFDAVILVDQSGRVAAFNPSAERLFGLRRQEVLSRQVTELSSGSWKGDVERLLRTPDEGELFHCAIETDDRTRSLEISATPVYDRSNNRLATSLILRDVTTRLQSERALRTNEKLAAVGKLASSIAHEINNPLEAVTNLVYLAQRTNDIAEVREFLDLADQELRRMSMITNQTLRFHKQASDPKLVTAEELLGSVIGIYRPRTTNSRVLVELRFRATNPILCFDGEIRQVLNNLVGNALDAMHTAGGRLLLRSREATNAGAKGIVITVADNGPGMSSMTVRKIFEAFFTTKGIGGTGLGLWISQEIVTHHSGSMRVRSSQRQGCNGTVFTLFLPFNAPLC